MSDGAPMGRRLGARRAAGRIALVYLAVSIGWILLSDRLVRLIVPDADSLTWVQSAKGLGFVLASAIVLWLVTRHYLHEAEAERLAVTRAYDETLAGWAAALDIRDASTARHTERVVTLTESLARRYGIDGEQLANIRRGAFLHDIGKMGVPDAVLTKPGALDDEEWRLMRRHPELAVEMLHGIAFLHSALDIPRAHHERWDGTGYPAGLAGEAIPLPARLFAVVDVYDALTSERPYRDPMPAADALAHIEAGSGSHFDPRAAEAFLAMMRDGAAPLDVPAPRGAGVAPATPARP